MMSHVRIQQLQHFTNLQFLVITNFGGIEALPEWLGNLTSLTILWIYASKKFKKLPSRQAKLHLTKLENLEFIGCPKLLLREGDQEWLKLSYLFLEDYSLRLLRLHHHLSSICVPKFLWLLLFIFLVLAYPFLTPSYNYYPHTKYFMILIALICLLLSNLLFWKRNYLGTINLF